MSVKRVRLRWEYSEIYRDIGSSNYWIPSIADLTNVFPAIDGTWGSTSLVIGPPVDTYVEYD